MGYTRVTALFTESTTSVAGGLECRVESVIAISPGRRILRPVACIVFYGIRIRWWPDNRVFWSRTTIELE